MVAAVSAMHGGNTFGAQPSIEDVRAATLRRKLEALQYKDPFEGTSMNLIEKARGLCMFANRFVTWEGAHLSAISMQIVDDHLREKVTHKKLWNVWTLLDGALCGRGCKLVLNLLRIVFVF